MGKNEKENNNNNNNNKKGMKAKEHNTCDTEPKI